MLEENEESFEIVELTINDNENFTDEGENYRTFHFDDFIIKSSGWRGYIAPVKNPILTLFKSGEWTLTYSLDHCQLKNDRRHGGLTLLVYFKSREGGGIERDASRKFALECHNHQKMIKGTYTASNYEIIKSIGLDFSGSVLDC